MRDHEDNCLGCFILMWLFIILSIVFGLGLCSKKANAQECVYVIHSPADFGFGGRMDYRLWRGKNENKDPLGFYTAFSYGDGGVYAKHGLRGHYKLTTGIMITLTREEDVRNVLMIGTSDHWLDKDVVRDPELSGVMYEDSSWEAGLAVKLQRIAFTAAVDLTRWELTLGFGVLF